MEDGLRQGRQNVATEEPVLNAGEGRPPQRRVFIATKTSAG